MGIKDPYDRSYEKSVTGTIDVLNSVADRGEDHIAYQPENRTVYLSLPDTLRGISAALKLAHSQGRMQDVKMLMAQGIQRLTLNSHHFIGLSLHLNDPAVLDAGLPMKPEAVVKSKPSILDLVPELTAKYLNVNKMIVTETMVIVIKRAGQNAVTELQVTDNPADENSWRKFGEGMFNQSRIEMRGFESAKRMYARARYHENGATGHWSPVVSILIH